MNRGIASVVMALCAAMLLAVMLLEAGAVAQPTSDPVLVARGAYLAKAGDCTACHRSPSGSPFAGGSPIASGFGDIISRNITPSRQFGIGNWSFEDFDRSMRLGVSPEGTHTYPAMPYTAYQGISPSDMRALYAYFQHGVAPVDVPTKRTRLKFPFNIRGIMVGWNLFFRPSGGFKPDRTRSAEVQRGQYLAQTLGHCSACHSPRNVLQGEETSHALGGGALNGWYAPNITSDARSGVGGWRNEELVRYFKEGRVAGKGGAGGGMSEVVQHSTQFLADADLRALAAYLKTVDPIHDPRDTRAPFTWTQPRAVSFDSYEHATPAGAAGLTDHQSVDGAVLYNGACAACHGVDGRGLRDDRYFPTLVGSTTAGSVRPNNLVMTVINGVARTGSTGRVQMPAFADLTDAQVAAVANYVTAHFGNPATVVTVGQVAEMRAGGPQPLIVRALPVLYGLVALVVAGLAFIIVRRRRRAWRRAAATLS